MKRRGPNRYDPNCHKFVDCWDSRAFLKSCHPKNLVFDPQTGVCDWGYKPHLKALCNAPKISEVTTPKPQKKPIQSRIIFPTTTSVSVSRSTVISNQNQQVTNFNARNCKDFKHLGYVCVPNWQCINGQVDKSSKRQFVQNYRATRQRPMATFNQGVFQPWTKKCPGWNKICCKKPSEKVKKMKISREKSKSICPGDYSGLVPHPYDCTKFANCWKGAGQIQSCGPGTHFNPKHSVCDWPGKANCQIKPLNLPIEEINEIQDESNEETVDYEDSEDFDISLNGRFGSPSNIDSDLWDATLSSNNQNKNQNKNQNQNSNDENSDEDDDSELWKAMLAGRSNSNNQNEDQNDQDFDLWKATLGRGNSHQNTFNRPSNANRETNDESNDQDFDLWKATLGRGNSNSNHFNRPSNANRGSNDRSNHQDSSNRNQNNFDRDIWEATLGKGSKNPNDNNFNRPGSINREIWETALNEGQSKNQNPSVPNNDRDREIWEATLNGRSNNQIPNNGRSNNNGGSNNNSPNTEQQIWNETLGQSQSYGRDKDLMRDLSLWNVTLLKKSGNIVFETPISGQKLRLRGGKSPFSGYLEISRNDQWGFVCDSGTWTFEEADIVCKQLGFKRGVRSTTQGLIHGTIDESRKMTETVDCQGNEQGIEDCRIKYKSRNGYCKSEESIVSITCVHDSFALCDDNEVPWGVSCYSVHFNRSSFTKAQEICEKEGKKLVELTYQEENDLLSELLVHSQYSKGLLSKIWTGGKARTIRRTPLYYWSGSNNIIDYRGNYSKFLFNGD